MTVVVSLAVYENVNTGIIYFFPLSTTLQHYYHERGLGFDFDSLPNDAKGVIEKKVNTVCTLEQKKQNNYLMFFRGGCRGQSFFCAMFFAFSQNADSWQRPSVRPKTDEAQKSCDPWFVLSSLIYSGRRTSACQWGAKKEMWMLRIEKWA